ncbi:MAG: 3'-5' exonuclease [Kiritimatiellae bacterium]|jgi:DNA polymerase-3 subunit epsilon|nr:3'-5' exonuclease [Kiritimatiellia bacterium]
MTFTAIDFETATGYRNSACAIGLVRVENGEILDTFSALIQPPGNEYWGRNIGVHGITPEDTACSSSFADIFPHFRHYLEGQLLVAHNASFDKSVLSKTMAHFDLDYEGLRVSQWECTLKIYRAKGFKPCKLSDCCNYLNIELNHHEALSDAIGCAHLYLKA